MGWTRRTGTGNAGLSTWSQKFQKWKYEFLERVTLTHRSGANNAIFKSTDILLAPKASEASKGAFYLCPGVESGYCDA